MPFDYLLTTDRPKLVQITKAPSKASKASLERGCKHCPTNHKPGINKVKGKVHGDRKLFVVGMAPGRDENIEEKEFVGKSGKFLWSELAQYKIKRSDCEVQNVVRCFPSDRRDGQLVMRDPSKEELHCCSLYNDRAIEKSNAKVYILLGEKAQKQWLGKEYKKARKIFWSEKLKAKVYCLYHPSYFVRGMFPQIHLDDFRKGLEGVASDLKSKGKHSRISYLEEQNYLGITTVKLAHKRAAIIERECTEKGIRTAVDIEDDTLDGKKTDLCVGFSIKPGQADVFVTGHPLARKVKGEWLPLKKKVQRKIRNIVKGLLSNPKIKKALQHGSYDGPQIKEELETTLRGYDFDTNYSEYLAYPDRRSYGLAAIAAARFPRFGEYKTITVPYCLPKEVSLEEHKIAPDDFAKMLELSKTTGVRMSQLPLKILVLYNGADCDITKRIELSTKKKVSLPLLRIYKDAAFILDRMEPNGPEFDYTHNKKLRKLYPTRLELTYDKMKQIAGTKFKIIVKKKVKEELVKEEKVLWDNNDPKTEFNPGSPIQVKALLFTKLNIPPPSTAFTNLKGFHKKIEVENKNGNFFAKNKRGDIVQVSPSTGKKVLELLSRKYEVAQLLTEFRRLSKIESTYLDSYEKCAKANGGKLRTKWWLTGTCTGRLSSGGGKADDKGNIKVVNLQNIHGDPNLKNQIVADSGWRTIYDAIHVAIKKAVGSKHLSAIAEVQARLARVPQYAKNAKEKCKAIEGELYSVIGELQSKLDKSLLFKKLCRRIVKKLGDIKVLLGFDQGQVEVRMMAQASGDKALIRDCMSGDIHSQVGHVMTGWSIEDIKKDKKTRTLTKNIHFGILFGLGVNGLFDFIKAKDPDTDITEEKAKELYENYFKAYPGVARFIEKCRAFVEEHGYIENMFGFKRQLGNSSSSQQFGGADEDDFDTEGGGGAFWGNQAINTPIQGAAHCLMLMAMAIMKRKAKKYKKLIPTLEIHDYMGFKIKLRDIFETFILGRRLLEKEPLKLIKKEYPDIKWKIPLVVEGVVGLRLGDPIEAYENDKPKTMSRILSEMFIETYTKEVRLDADLKMVA